jgi:hypothetical protein
MNLAVYLRLVPLLRMDAAIPVLRLRAFMS